MKNTKWRRILSWILTLTMIFSQFAGTDAAITAFAADDPVSTWDELQAKVNAGGDIILGNDISPSTNNAGNLVVPNGITTVINLNGHSLSLSNNQIFVNNGLTIKGEGSVSSDTTYCVVVNNGDFVLEGSSLSAAADNGSVVVVGSGATFTMKSGVISDNKANGVRVDDNGTFIMVDGEIFGNKDGVYNSGTFTMEGGYINNNTNTGVVNFKNFAMTNGVISSNTAGVSNSGTGVFILDNGSIYENTSKGVYNNASAKFTMKGGAIYNNSSAYGGAGVDNFGVFSMSGGEIYGNTSTGLGAGIYCESTSKVEMTGGRIYNNASETYGDGIYLGAGTTLTVSDNARVEGNETDNIYINGGIIKVAGKLNDAALYVTAQDKSAPIAEAGEGYDITDDDVSKFIYDEAYYSPALSENKIYIGRQFTVEWDTDVVKDVEYKGEAWTFTSPVKSVKDDKTTLSSTTDYDITYENNIDAGKATIKVVGKGLYIGCVESEYFTIKKKSVSVDGITAADKTYNGTDSAVLDTTAEKVTVYGLVGDQTVKVSANGAFADVNAGKGKVVNITDLTISGDAAKNYELDVEASQQTASANIAQRPVKVYALDQEVELNGEVDSDVSKASLSSDAVEGHKLASITISTNSTATHTTNGVLTPSNAKIVDSSDADVTDNYDITYVPGTLSVNKAKAAVDGVVPADLIYNGKEQKLLVSENAAVTGGKLMYVSANEVSANTVWSEDVPTAKDAGTYKVWYMVSGNASHVSSNAVSVNVTIAPKAVTISGITAEDKVYDGTVSVNVITEDVTINGLVSQNNVWDKLSVSADGVFADKNAGTDKKVIISNITISGNASANYVLAESGQQTEAKASISRKWVTVSAGIAASDKVYDATNTVSLKFDNVSINGVVDDDKANVSVTAKGQFRDVNVSENEIVNISDIALTGSASGNYSLSSNDLQKTTSANITQKEVTVKAKDQTINVGGHIISDPQMATLTGAIKGHTLYAVSLNTTWDTSKRTTDAVITVSVDEVKIRNTNGVDVTANYKIISENGVLTVLSGVQAEVTKDPEAKVLSYNQTEQELVTAGEADSYVLYAVSDNSVTAPADGWSKAVPTAKNAGTYYVWFKAGGTDTLDESDADKVSVTIDQASISVNGVGVSEKTYDGTTVAVLNTTNMKLEGVYKKDDVDVEVTVEFETANAGDSKLVNITYGDELTGDDADNYTLDLENSQKTTTAKISAKPVTVTAKDQTVSLNGKIVNTVSMATLEGVVLDEHVIGEIALTSSSTENITDNGWIRVNSVKIVDHEGHDVTDNYSVDKVDGVLIVLSAESYVSKVPTAKTSLEYNKTALALLNSDGTAFGGELQYVLGSESEVGTNGWSKDIPTGTNAGTYYVWYKVAGDSNHDDTEPAGPIEVTIDTADVTVNGIKVTTKTYDGTTAASFDTSSAVFDGKFGNDVLTVTSVSGEFKDANVGTNKTVDIDSIELGGSGAVNYTLNLDGSQKEATGNITKRDVKVTAKDQTVSLNGAIATTADMATLSSNAVGGHTLAEVTLTASSTAHVTTDGEITASDAVIKSGSNDVTANYEIEYVPGTLTVNPVAAIVTNAPTAKTLSFNNADQVLLNSDATVSGGSIKYALSDNAATAPADDAWGNAIPTGKETGDYYVWYKAAADDDHFDSEAACVTATISAAEFTIFFDANYEGGKGVSQNVTVSKADDVVTLSANTISRNGFEFVEWNTDADGEGDVYADGAEYAPVVNAEGVYADVTLYAQWESVSIDSISINKAPDKTEYVEGEKFDPEGMVVVAIYSNNTEKEISDYTYTPSGNLAVSDDAVIISYTEGGRTFTTSQNITVVSVSLDSISINKLPDKTEYVERELFDPTGMEVVATYNNGEKKTVTDYTYTPDGHLTLADTTVVVSYTEKEVTRTASFNIVVSENTAPALVSISINKAPAKTEYFAGDAFDPAGMEVSANYTDGSSKDVTASVVCTPSANLAVSDNVVIVSYTEEGIIATASQNITVKPVSLNSISINKLPAKTVYEVGEVFDPAGMEVVATYTNGEKKTVSGYTLTPSASTNLTASDNKITVSYTEDGITCTAEVAIKVKSNDANVIVEDEEYKVWNLYEDNTEHTFIVEGASANAVKNSNTKSAAYFDAELNGDTITVTAKGDLKKAAKAANAVLEFVTDDGVVEFQLPVEYKKPALKLSVTNVTVKNGVETTVKTTILRKSPAGVFEPMDLTNAAVSFAGKDAEILENGEIGITVNGAVKGQKIKVAGEGWVSSDPVELKFTVKGSSKDVVNVEMNGLKTVIVNSNAKSQSFEFPVFVNGEAADDEKVTVEDKKGTGLAKIEGGNLVIAYPEEGTVKKGNYTIALKSGNSKAVKVKVKVSDKALSDAVKLTVKSKYDVVTGQKMVIVPNFKDLGGKLEDVSIEKDGFSAVVNEAGNIVVDYEGSAYNTKNLKMGDLTFKLTVEGVEDEVAVTAKNVKAKKTAVKVTAAKVFVKNGAGTANLVCSYKDSAGNMHLIAPKNVNLDKFKKVTAVVDEDDPTVINITSLSGKSGSVKAIADFGNGYTKAVTIKVKAK